MPKCSLFYIFKKMLESVLCSNIASSQSSGNHLFHKAKYMGRSCLNLVWAINFDRSALETWNKHSWTAIWKAFQLSVPFSIRKVNISYFFFPPFLDVLRSFVKVCLKTIRRFVMGSSKNQIYLLGVVFRSAAFPSVDIQYSLKYTIKHIFRPSPKDVAHRYATFLCSLDVEL